GTSAPPRAAPPPAAPAPAAPPPAAAAPPAAGAPPRPRPPPPPPPPPRPPPHSGWNSASTCAIRIFGFVFEIARPMRPTTVGSPTVNFFQVLPPSTVLKMPPFLLPSTIFCGSGTPCELPPLMRPHG